MQITFSFEPHELPSLLAQIIRVANGDVGDLVSEIMRQHVGPMMAQPATETPAQSDACAVTPPQAPPAYVDTVQAVPSAATSADVPPKKRRGRKPKAVAPHVTPVDPADLAPSLPLAASPVSDTAASPAAETPLAVAPSATRVPPAPVAPPEAATASGSIPSAQDVRDAYVGAEMREAGGEAILAVLARFGITRVRDVPEARRAEIIAAFNALRAA